MYGRNPLLTRYACLNFVKNALRKNPNRSQITERCLFKFTVFGLKNFLLNNVKQKMENTMSDKNTAGSSTATNSTNNGENKMSYFDELSKHLSKSVITKLNKLGQDITEELVTEIVAAQGQGFTGIGSKTCETIKEAMDLIVVEEKVETPKIKPISRKVKSVINNQFTFGMR